MTGATEGCQIVEIVGSAAFVERRDVVGLQTASSTALNASPAVPVEGGPAGPGPSPARRSQLAQVSTHGNALREHDLWIVAPHFRNDAIPNEEAPVNELVRFLLKHTEAIVKNSSIAPIRLIIRKVSHKLKRLW